MSYNLEIGFKDVPKDIENILTNDCNFKGLSIETGDGSKVFSLQLSGKLDCQISLYYHPSLSQNDPLKKISPDLVASATISGSEKPHLSFRLQRDIARILANYYGAMIYDPQTGKVIQNGMNKQ